MTGLLKVGSTNCETVSCRKSRHGLDKEVTVVDESLEMGEESVTYTHFNHMIHSSTGILTIVTSSCFKFWKKNKPVGDLGSGRKQ